MDRTNVFISLVGFRFGAAGLALVLAPRWFRNLLADFVKMSDTEMRLLGYVLVGASGAILAQQASRRALTAKIDALSKERAPIAEAA